MVANSRFNFVMFVEQLFTVKVFQQIFRGLTAKQLYLRLGFSERLKNLELKSSFERKI